ARRARCGRAGPALVGVRRAGHRAPAPRPHVRPPRTRAGRPRARHPRPSVESTDEFRHPRTSSQSKTRGQEETMGKLVVTEFITLDGVIEDPGGGETFDRGGWAFRFDRGPEGDKFKLDELLASDAQLLGRVTYEGFARAW